MLDEGRGTAGSGRCQTKYEFIELQRTPELGIGSLSSLDPGISPPCSRGSLRQISPRLADVLAKYAQSTQLAPASYVQYFGNRPASYISASVPFEMNGKRAEF